MVKTRTTSLSSHPYARAQVYEPAVKLIEKLDPDYAAGEYVVQFAYMNSPNHYVKCHIDNDVSYQYLLTLGDFRGATLRAYTAANKSVHVDFAGNGCIVQFDGRLPHEVISDGFSGDRFTVIWYKHYDHRKQTRDDPLLETPRYVDESTLHQA